MDSQELENKQQEVVENTEKTTMEQPTATTENVETVDATKEDKNETKNDSVFSLTKEELCENLKLLLEKSVIEVRSEVENIKKAFYKKNQEELDSQRDEYEKEGGNPKDFIPNTAHLEEEFKQLLNNYKEKKAKYIAEIQQEKESNQLKKQRIIDQIKQLTETHEDVSSNITTFRELQQKWKEIGDVPQSAVATLWKDYNYYQDKFWDLIKINNELREYDFKKNLEMKLGLCEKAEALDKEENVVTAFRLLQKLHEEWREIGSVAREKREELWSRFKSASTVINKKHQAHFEKLHEEESENLEKKEALCKKIEQVDTTQLKTYKDWDESTKEVMALQEEWRKLGFVPRKLNKEIYEKYRKACDTFFDAKANFYKTVKEELAQNLEKKKALCEKVEELKESTEWKKTADKLVQIQKEWKEIGSVPRKHSEALWKRFIGACDYFFEKKNEQFSGQKKEEVENLAKKKAIIEKLKNFQKAETEKESLATVRTLTDEWKTIGFVPFKEKDTIYQEYRKALDKVYDELNVEKSQRHLDNFQNRLDNLDGDKERRKLVRTYEYLKSEIATYENNLNFLSISSKKGGGLLQEMQRKVEKMKNEMQLIEKKINMIDQKQ